MPNHIKCYTSCSHAWWATTARQLSRQRATELAQCTLTSIATNSVYICSISNSARICVFFFIVSFADSRRTRSSDLTDSSPERTEREPIQFFFAIALTQVYYAPVNISALFCYCVINVEQANVFVFVLNRTKRARTTERLPLWFSCTLRAIVYDVRTRSMSAGDFTSSAATKLRLVLMRVTFRTAAALVAAPVLCPCRWYAIYFSSCLAHKICL